MSVEAVTEALHEHLYEKLNDSPETEEKKIRHLIKGIAKSHKEQMDKPTNIKKMDCNRCPELVETTRMSGQRKEMRKKREVWPLRKMLQNKQESKPHTVT